MIIAQGGNIGGWALYAKGGKLKYCYNLLGIQYFYVEATSALPAGEHQVRMEFAYAGGGLGKGGTVSLFVDGKKVGEGKVAATAAMIFSADDGCDVGRGHGIARSPRTTARAATRSPVASRACRSRSPRPPRAADHLVSPEDAVRIAMARQ